MFFSNYISITFVTSPTPIRNFTNELIWRIPFISWMQSIPCLELFIFSNINKSTTIEFTNFVYLNFPLVKLNFINFSGKKNRPLLQEMLVKACELSTKKYIILINSDIIISKRFNGYYQYILLKLERERKKNFLIVSRRVQTSFKNNSLERINENNIFEYERFINFNGEHYFYGCDSFLFEKNYPPFNYSHFPKFYVGLPGWDIYFLAKTYLLNNLIISFDGFEDVFHLDHKKKWNNEKVPLDLEIDVNKSYCLLHKQKIPYITVENCKIRINNRAKLINNNNKKIFRNELSKYC